MTALTVHDFPALGFVPCPGDWNQADSVAQSVQVAAKALVEVDHVLRGADDGDWRGEAARAFREMLAHDFRPKLENAQQSFGAAATALTDWASYMKGQQAKAAGLEKEAQQHAATLSSSQSHLSGLPAAPKPGDPAPKDPTAAKQAKQNATDRTNATTAVNNARSALNEVRSRAHKLAGDYQHEGKNAASKLKNAADAAPGKPGFFSRMADSIGGMLDFVGDKLGELGDKLIPLLAKLAPLLNVIANVASLLSTVLGLLAFIPGLQFLAIPALILGGVALLAQYGAAVGESGSFLKGLENPAVIMDALTLAFGLGALKSSVELVQVAQAAKEGEEVSSTGKIISNMAKIHPDEMPNVPSWGKLMFPKAGEPAYGMSTAEFGWRAARYHCTWGGNIMVAIGAKDTVGFVKGLVGAGPGPLTNNSPIASTP